jgi:hypothetical protein
MTLKSASFQVLAALLGLAAAASAPRAAAAASARMETDAIRQSVIEAIRDEIQRRTGEVGSADQDVAEPGKSRAMPKRVRSHVRKNNGLAE